MYGCHWPLPANVRIAMTQRHGGVSQPPFDSLNLGLHVGDDPASVQANRAL
ncbi:laccase domain-containing protein, partial [Klebsiella pneumoniae]